MPSPLFIETVQALLDSRKLVLATVALQGEGIIRLVKQRPDCRVVTVTIDNRDRLAMALSEEIRDTMETAR